MRKALRALGAFDIVDFDEVAALLAGRIHGDLERAGTPLGRIDPMIAGIALARDATLVTGNVRHYERVREAGYALRLENWRDAPVQ